MTVYKPLQGHMKFDRTFYNDLFNNFEFFYESCNKAVIDAAEAFDNAYQADLKITSLQQQVNDLVIAGDSSPEAAQARSGFDTLNDRLNDSDGKIDVLSDQNGASPMSFGAVGDGVADDTQAFVNANVLSLVIRLPRGKTFRLDNFVPKEGTVLVAQGATIARHSQTYYSTTTSSAAVVITNKDVRLIGGRYTDLSPTQEVFSGSILIEKGSVNIEGALIEDSWGGIFGHANKNASNVCDYVSITNCEIRNCNHNCYLGDILNFNFHGNHSHHSGRDGLRTYRNVQNATITNNHIYENGDGAVGQSQDGMDLFIAGKRFVIEGNFIYNNVSQGIDVKRNSSGDGETVLDQEYIISNNFIYGNGFSAISMVSQDNTRGYINNLIISDNHLYQNGDYGIVLNHADILNIHDNQIYKNSKDGIRIENCVEGGEIHHNTVYDNTGVGVIVLSTALNVDLTNNNIRKGVAQTNGISYNSNGICKDNNVRGHSINITGTPTSTAIGVNQYTNYDSTKTNVMGFVAEKDGVVNNIVATFNGTGTFRVTISKRNLNGTFNKLLHDADVVVSTGYQLVNLNFDTSARVFSKGQLCYISISIVSGSYADAKIGFSMLT